MLIRLGHSPDPDDAFMFWALAAGAVDTRGFEFEHVLQDIQTLNEWALEGRLEVTAISLHAYPFVQDRYALLPHGASMGRGYGPVVVAREPLTLEQLRELEIAVPGRMTTAFLALRLALGDVAHRELPFDRDHRRGLVRPRGRRAGHPRGPADLRGGGPAQGARPRRVVAARDRAAAAARRQRRAARPRRRGLRELSAVLLDSIQAGLDNRAGGDALRDAASGAGSTRELADRFVGMYVNELTCDYGDEGRKAVEELLRRGDAIGAFPEPVRLDYVS